MANILFVGSEREALIQGPGSTYQETASAGYYRPAPYARAASGLGGGDYYRAPLGGPYPLLSVHVATRNDGFGAGGGDVVAFLDSADNIFLRLFGENPTWHMQYWDGAAWQNIGVSVNPTYGSVGLFDITLDMSTPSAAEVHAYYNGIEFGAGTVDISDYVSDIEEVRFYRGQSDGQWFSEVVITDSDEKIAGVGLTTFPATSNGTDTGGLGNPSDVNEINMDLGTFIALNGAGVRRSFVSTDRGLNTDRIVLGFTVAGRMSKTGSTGPQHVKPYVLIGGTRYYGSTFALTVSADPYKYTWVLNPDTAAPWTAAEVNDPDLEWGWEAVA